MLAPPVAATTDSEDNCLLTTGSENNKSTDTRSVLSRGAAVLGVVGFICALLGTGTWAVSFQTTAHESPRMLFEDTDVVNVLTSQIMADHNRMRAVSSQKQVATRQALGNAIGRDLREFNIQLGLQSPHLAAAIDQMPPVTREEKDGMLHMMSYLGDVRVHRVGLDAALALRETEGMDRKAAHRHIVSRLRSRASELHELHEEVFGGLPGRLSLVGRRHGDLKTRSRAVGRQLTDTATADALTAALNNASATPLPALAAANPLTAGQPPQLSMAAIQAIAAGAPAGGQKLSMGDLQAAMQGASQGLAPVVGGLVNGTAAPVHYEDEVFQSFSGAIEEAKMMFDSVIMMAMPYIERMSKKEHAPIFEDLAKAGDPLLELLDCEVKAGVAYFKTKQLPMMQMMDCYTHINRKGMKALEAVEGDLGLKDMLAAVEK